MCQSVDYKTPSVVCRDGAGVSPLTRFCRDYKPYLFIGVIGLDRCFFYIKKSFFPISYLYIDGSGTCPLTLKTLLLQKLFLLFMHDLCNFR